MWTVRRRPHSLSEHYRNMGELWKYGVTLNGLKNIEMYASAARKWCCDHVPNRWVELVSYIRLTPCFRWVLILHFGTWLKTEVVRLLHSNFWPWFHCIPFSRRTFRLSWNQKNQIASLWSSCGSMTSTKWKFFRPGISPRSSVTAIFTVFSPLHCEFSFQTRCQRS